MIYRDRKYFPILTLTEDRDYVTYDELIRVLEERPSNVVYIERGGILCGLITNGRIMRRADDRTRRVLFSKNFTYVHPKEYMRVRQIFRETRNIKNIPIISEDGHLLGDYARFNDFIGRDYAEHLCKDPYVIQGLKENIENAVFIQPREGGYKARMFSWWRQRLESEGIHLQVIHHWEIKDYNNKIFLFVDEYETLSAEALNQRLYQQNPYKTYISITDYLYSMKRIADLSFLEELQNQGVFIMSFNIKENSNQFLAALNQKITKHNEEYGVNPDYPMSEKLKRSFFDELYCEAYKTHEFPLPMSCHTQFGIPYLSDAETEFIHIKNGERLTVNQPEEYDRCVYLYGSCVVVGRRVPDQYTISSLLQREIN